MSIRIEIDRERCIGNGMCAALAPSDFDLDDDNKAFALVDVVPEETDDIREAVLACPVEAIRLRNLTPEETR